MSKQKLKPSPNAQMHPKIASAKFVFRSNEYSNDDLSFEDFYELSQQPCFYCKAKPSRSRNVFKTPSKNRNEYNIVNGTFTYNGVDRIDSSKSHSKDNCVPCCSNCNTAKNDMSVEEFKNWLKKIYNHFIKQSK